MPWQHARSIPQREPEESALVATMCLTTKVEIGTESIWKLTEHVAVLVEGNLEARLCGRYARQMTCMRIKNDNVIATGKGRQIGVVVDCRPTQAISTCSL